MLRHFGSSLFSGGEGRVVLEESLFQSHVSRFHGRHPHGSCRNSREARTTPEEETNIPIATAHFAMKAQKAQASAHIRRDGNALASKTLMDNMEAEAHANIVLATDLGQPIQADDIALPNGARTQRPRFPEGCADASALQLIQRPRRRQEP